MSGLVPIDAYINDPIPARYGMFVIFSLSSDDVGDMALDKVMFGSIGVETVYASVMLKHFSIVLMYVCGLGEGDCALAAVTCDRHA